MASPRFAPGLSEATLDFLEIESCEEFEDGWLCVGSDGSQAIVYPRTSPSSGFELSQLSSLYNPNDSALFQTDLGAIMLVPDINDFPMLFIVAPYPGMVLLDTDCPVPEPADEPCF